MNYLDFTAEESALIAIYKEPTLLDTIVKINLAHPHMNEAFYDLATQSVAKLAAMSEADFAKTTFTLADEYEPEPDDAA
jgi:hypothetical protein